MPRRITCTACGHEQKMADDFQGKAVRCKECGETLAVERQTVRRKSSNARARDDEVDRPRRRNRRDNDEGSEREANSTKWLLIGGGALAAVAILVVVIVLIANSGSEPANNRNVNNPIVKGPNQADGAGPQKLPGAALQGKLADKTGEQANEKPPVKPPPLTPWTARPDPVPEVMVAPTELAVIPFATNFTRFHFPSTPSPFVFVHHGAPANHAYAVYDLYKAKMVSSGTLKASLDRAVLSPDGKFLATIDGRVNKLDGLRCFSLVDGREVSAVGVRAPGFGFEMDFVGNDHLLTNNGENCEVWDVTKGVKTGEYKLEESYFAQARSPGRKYFACFWSKKNVVQIREALTGKVVGEVRLPVGEKDTPLEPRNLAFSLDGQELACIARWGVAEKRYQLLSWSMLTGELVNDHGLGSTGPNHFLAQAHEDGAFQWLPDRSGWVIGGRAWIDAESGEPVYEFTPRFGHLTKLNRLVGMYHLTTVDERPAGPGQTIKELRVVALPKDQIAAGIAKARGPGLALAPAKPGDLASAKKIAAAGQDQWVGLASDPPPTAAAQLASKPLRLPAQTENVEEVLFSGADVGQVVVLSAVPVNEISVTRRVHADRIDLATGKVLGTLDLFTGRKLEMPKREDANGSPPLTGSGPIKGAISLDGSRLLVRQRLKPGRLDLWDLNANKHFVGWLPSGDEKTAVEWFAFLDNGRVLTAGGNRLVLWKVPECQAVYVVEGVPGGAALSPGRKLVAFTTEKQLVVLDAASGECKGRTSVPGGETRPAVAPLFRQDGVQIAASYSEAGHTKFARWQLDSGKLLDSFQTGQTAQPVFAGQHTLLLGSHLHQFNLDRPLCEYFFRTMELVARSSPDDRIWWIRTGVYGAELVAQSPIHAQLVDMTSAIARGEIQKLPEPGKEIQVAVTANRPSVIRVAQDATEQRLRALKQPVGRAGYWLKLQINARDTGQKMPYEFKDLSGQKTNRLIPAVVADCTVTITDDRGETVYQRPMTIGPPTTFTSTGDDLAAVYQALDADVHLWLARKLEFPENLYRVGGRPVLLPLQLQLAVGQ